MSSTRAKEPSQHREMADGQCSTASKDENGQKQRSFDLFSFEQADDGALHVTQQGGDALAKTFGSQSPAVNETLYRQAYMTLSVQEFSEGSMDHRGFMPAIIRDIAPRDAIERMLAVQMSSTHVAMIRVGRFMSTGADTLTKFEAYERAYNKLARTFTAQMEALRKHRNGGKQTVTVQHVNVEDGGRAIVGNIEAGGRGRDEK